MSVSDIFSSLGIGNDFLILYLTDLLGWYIKNHIKNDIHRIDTK